MAGPTRGAADGGNAPDDDLDAQWAELTARLGDLRLPPSLEEPEPDPVPQQHALPATPGPRDYTPDAESDDDDPARDLVDGFVPPDPDPFARAEPVLVIGWVAVLGGLALMLLSVLLWREAPGMVWLVSAASLAVGIGLLLWRMPSRRDSDDYDDGAVV